METGYYCKECKEPALVTKDGGVAKQCPCNAPVVTDMIATVKGVSKIGVQKSSANS